VKLPQWAAVAALTLAAAAFAVLNLGERATLSLGIVRFQAVPVAWIAFGAFLLGMLTMFLLGLRHDREVRRLLQQRERPHRGERPVHDEPPGVAM
jgi:uncharacterized integral membrane protein